MIKNNKVAKSPVELTKDDFLSDQMVKWCPGCGAHAILAAVGNVFPKIGYRKENFTMISGIGCSSRFPYYVDTFGFHGIHGRAAAIASGVKIANPGLSVWVATGDGDSMAIGGNHFIHVLRRNIDINILLFNNRIYGLTKGQYSPTTPLGAKTKTSPDGTIEHPFTVSGLVMGAQGTFYARVPDNDVKLMTEVLYEAANHDGTSVIEILQNCVIFADKVHDMVTNKKTRHDRQLFLKHGEPMIFGENREKGIVLNGTQLEVVEIGKNGITEDDILVHDQYAKNPSIQRMVGWMKAPDFPVAMGVIRAAPADTYDELLLNQINTARETSDIQSVNDLLRSGQTWEI
ncbi:MAG: 2-oxoacid:ferredoxin oxidoreductase subunit beta [Bacteroidales bacterium]